MKGAETLLPPDCNVTGTVRETGAGLEASGEKAALLKGYIPEGRQTLVFRGKAGAGKGGLTIELKDREGASASVLFRSQDYRLHKGDIFPDSYLSIGWNGGRKGWGNWFVRPKADMYREEVIQKRKEEWASLPGASATSFTVELRPALGGRVEVWVEGQFANELPLGAPVSYRVALQPGALLESLRFEPVQPAGAVTLPVERTSRKGVMEGTQLQFEEKVDLPAPFRAVAGRTEGISIAGLGAFGGWMSSDLQSYFWRRHASHGLSEQRMFSVPLAIYSHAWVLCAREDDPEKADAFTFRVTRYAKSRGSAMADTIVHIPPADAKDTREARRVGRVSYGPPGSRKEAPLWLVRVPIQNGVIQDLLYIDEKRAGGVGTHRYLDLELLDLLQNVEKAEAFPPSLERLGRQYTPTNPQMTAYDIYPSTPPQTSGATVFAIQLEKSPAALQVRSHPEQKAFYASDHAEFLAKVSAEKAGEYRVEWKIADVEGGIVGTGSQTLKLEAGGEAEARIPIKTGNGWFAVQTRLLDGDDRQLIDNRSSFVMMQPDTRKAGYESPYYGWWFGDNHGSDIKLEEIGPLLQRLGIRRTSLPESMPESLTKEYGFTDSTVSWLAGRNALKAFSDGTLTLEQAVAEHEAEIRRRLELWPSIDRMLVFHESGSHGAPFPSEIWGEPARNHSNIKDENSPEALLRREGAAVPAEDEGQAREKWEKSWPKRMEYLNAMASMVREKFPGLKMQYGNDGNSLGIVGELFRQKFPRKWIDTIAIEDLGQTILPENPRLGGFQSAWFLRETARRMGYGDVPVTACTEWIGRMTEKLGLRTQAEWKARDTLLALAYGFDTICVAGINDAGDGYYYSIWANGGLTGRYPEMAPKPAYAAIATLTQVLDQAKFVRFVPSGSTVLYVQEFQRGGDWVYAVWTPRGTREVKLDFGKDAPRPLIDLYGREKQAGGTNASLNAATAVQYLVSKEPLQAVQPGATAFPDDPAPKEIIQEIPLNSLAAVEIIPRPDVEETSRKNAKAIPKLRQGKFKIREVEDPEMGACLELELIPEGDRWDFEHEYMALKLKEPVKTDAKNAGVWIKGNGSWGAVNLSKSQSWGPWATNGNLNMGWSANQTLNFDGWNFISYPYYDWVRPINNSVTGLVITLPRKALVGTEMQPVQNPTVRIKKIVLY